MRKIQLVTEIINIIRCGEKDIYWFIDADIKDVVQYIMSKLEE